MDFDGLPDYDAYQQGQVRCDLCCFGVDDVQWYEGSGAGTPLRL